MGSETFRDIEIMKDLGFTVENYRKFAVRDDVFDIACEKLEISHIY